MNRSTLARDPEPTARAIADVFGDSEGMVETVVGLIRSNYRNILEIDPTPVAQLIVAALTQPG